MPEIATHQKRLAALAQSHLFQSLSEADLEIVSGRTKLRQFFPEDTIVWQGQPSDSLYLILNGIVAVKHVGPDGDKLLAYLVSGNTFGEVGILENRSRSATVAAVSEVDVLVLRREDFIDLLERYPKVAIALARTLGNYLVEANRRLSNAEKKVRMLVVASLSPHCGATSLGNLLAEALYRQHRSATAYLEFPRPHAVLEGQEMEYSGQVYPHPGGYDILLNRQEACSITCARITIRWWCSSPTR